MYEHICCCSQIEEQPRINLKGWVHNQSSKVLLRGPCIGAFRLRGLELDGFRGAWNGPRETPNRLLEALDGRRGASNSLRGALPG